MTINERSIINDIWSALSEENYETAHEHAQKLQELYDNGSNLVQNRVDRNKAVYANGEVDGDSLSEQDLKNTILNGAMIRQTRMILFMTVGMLAHSHSKLKEEGKLRETREVAIEASKSLAERRGELMDTTTGLNDTVVPASLSIESTSIDTEEFTIGKEVPVTIFVENVGDQPADDVKVEVKTIEGLNVDTNSHYIGTLNQGDSVSVTTNVSGSLTGSHTLKISVSGAEASGDQKGVVIQTTSEESNSKVPDDLPTSVSDDQYLAVAGDDGELTQTELSNGINDWFDSNENAINGIEFSQNELSRLINYWYNRNN